MRLLHKVLVSCAIFGAVSALAIAASAASVGTLTATYDAAAGTVTISAIDAYNATVTGQNTLLVLNKDSSTVADADIVQIDQGEKTAIVGTAIPVGTLANGTYYVRVGGADNGYASGTFTVGATTHNVLVGDTDGSAAVDASDATQILLYCSSATSTIGEATTDTYKAAMMCTGTADTVIDASDATQVLLYASSAGNGIVGTSVAVSN